MREVIPSDGEKKKIGLIFFLPGPCALSGISIHMYNNLPVPINPLVILNTIYNEALLEC